MCLKATSTLIVCLAGMHLGLFAQDALDPGEHQATLDGVWLWYKVAGHVQPEQAPVLFLHGGSGYHSYSCERTIGARLERHVETT